MKFPTVALRINVPRGMKEIISEVGTDYLKGLGKRFQEDGYNDGPKSFHNLSKHLSLVFQLDGWYELRGISMAPEIPRLQEIEARKFTEYQIRLQGDLHFGERSLKDVFYSDSFRKKHIFPISIYTSVHDERGGLVRKDFTEDELKVDFSRLRFMQPNYFPAPMLSNPYQFELSDNGRGLTLEVAKAQEDTPIIEK